MNNKKGDIKTWDDYEKLPILTKEELINGFPNDIVKKVEDFNISTRSSGSSGKFVTLAVSPEAIYNDTIQGFRQYCIQSGNKYDPQDIVLFIYTCPWWITEVNGLYKSEFLPTTTNTTSNLSFGSISAIFIVTRSAPPKLHLIKNTTLLF